MKDPGQLWHPCSFGAMRNFEPTVVLLDVLAFGRFIMINERMTVYSISIVPVSIVMF